MAKIKVKWVKSAIGFAERQKRTIKALGFKKLQSISLAYHSFIMFRNGVKSLSACFSLSIPLLMAINLTPFSLNSISV